MASAFPAGFSLVSGFCGSRMNRGIWTIGITRAGFTVVAVGRRGLSAGLGTGLETGGRVLVGGCVRVITLGRMVDCRARCVLPIRLRRIEKAGAAAIAETTIRTAVTSGRTLVR